jgi:hypothetical protein
MRYRLRTLLILATLLPPIGAHVYWDRQRRLQERRLQQEAQDKQERRFEHQRGINLWVELNHPYRPLPYPNVPPRK